MDLQDPVTDAPATRMLRLRHSDRQQSFFFWATIGLSICIALLSTTAGFIYGDYYGRKHAQYDNPELRNYYAGQCYSFIDTQLKKTIKTSFEKQSKQLDQSKRFDELREGLLAIQFEMASMQGRKPVKDKDAAKDKNKLGKDSKDPKKKYAQAAN